ncbi:MAG: hypothetical protein IIB44_02695 [Candidatus Marinimicrobia bacterium]|nr:hypothetical protein [Candidatus Neomarinimicrobiota bacterium]
MKNIYCDSYLTPSGSDFLLSDFSIHIIPLQGIHESAGIVFSYLAQDEDQPALLSPRQVRVRTTCGLVNQWVKASDLPPSLPI